MVLGLLGLQLINQILRKMERRSGETVGSGERTSMQITMQAALPVKLHEDDDEDFQNFSSSGLEEGNVEQDAAGDEQDGIVLLTVEASERQSVQGPDFKALTNVHSSIDPSASNLQKSTTSLSKLNNFEPNLPHTQPARITEPQPKPSSLAPNYGPHFELGDIDAESDQVLLGSAYEDTTRAMNTKISSPINFSEAQPYPQLKSTHERSATQQAERQSQRQNLLEQMQEDESAQDYPIHDRFSQADKRQEESPGQVEDTPALGSVAKDSMMSFGFMGNSTTVRQAESTPHQQEQAQVLPSELSEDFYENTGRSAFSKMSSTRSPEAEPIGEVRNLDGLNDQDVQNGDFYKYPTMQQQQTSKADPGLLGYETQQRETPLFARPDDKVWQSAAPQREQQFMGQQHMPMAGMAGLQQQARPLQHRNDPRQQYFQPQSNNNNQISMQNEFDQIMGSSQTMALPERYEHQSQTIQQRGRDPPFHQSAMHHQTVLPRMSPLPTQTQAGTGHHAQMSTSNRPPEQFLTLDHFLGETQSQPMGGGAMTERSQVNMAATYEKLPVGGLRERSNLTPSAHAQVTSVDQYRQQRQPQVARQNPQGVPSRSPRMASTSPLRVDPDEIKRRQLTRQQIQERKRKEEFEELRRQAKQREMLRLTKLRAVVLIQKWVRGHLCRLEYARMRANFRYIRKLRRLLSIAYGRRKQRFLKQLVFVVKEAGKRRQKEFEEEIGAFCATLIQKVWRGYHFRKVVKRRLMREFRSKRQLRALIQGWRTRCILFRTRECISLKRDIGDIDRQRRHWQHKLRTLNPATTTKQEHVMIKTSLKQLYEERRQKVTQLIRTVAHLKQRGRWVYQLLPNKPQPSPMARTQDKRHQVFDQKQQRARQVQYGGQDGDESMQLDNETLFKYAPPIESNERFLGGMASQGRGQFGGSGGILLDDFPPAQQSIHDETAQNLIASVGGGLGKDIISREEEDDDLNVMWPSSKPEQNPSPAVEIEDDLAMMWPSQKPKKEQPPEEDLMIWPSQQNKADRRSANVEDESDARLPAREDNLSALGIVWPSANTKDVKASGDLNSSEKQPQSDRFVNPDSIIIPSNQANKVPAHWEDMPIQTKHTAGANPYSEDAEIPIRAKSIPPARGVAEPTPPLVDQSHASSHAANNESVAVQPPKFELNDFEKMIEKAMNDAGQAPPPQPSGPEPSKKAPEKPKTASAKEKEEEMTPAQKKKKEAAAALLEKRKRYDPRKALKKGKKGPVKKAESPRETQPVDDPLPTQCEPVKEPNKSRKASFVSKPVTEEEAKVVAPAQEVAAPKGGGGPPNSFQQRQLARAEAAKAKGAKARAKAEAQAAEDYHQPAEESKQPLKAVDESTSNAAPKPFLKRKTKTMQPAKINWKTKSRIDCWNESKQSGSNKREVASPPQNSNNTKTMIETQHAMEDSLPKFSDNQPDKVSLRQKATDKSRELQQMPRMQVEESKIDLPQPYEAQDTEYDCETVPNEDVEDKMFADQVQQQWPQDYSQGSARAIKDDVMGSPGDLLKNQAVKPAPGRIPAPFSMQNNQNQRAPAKAYDSHEDFDAQLKPPPSNQSKSSFKQQFLSSNIGANQPKKAPLPNSRQPAKIPPDMDQEIMNYNTFSQPEFAQPSHHHQDQFSLGQSYISDANQNALPFMNHADTSNILSEIHAQISSVMTHHDASHVFGTGLAADNNLGPEGSPQTNLELDELQKVFDLFHVQSETVEEPVSASSLARLHSFQRGGALGRPGTFQQTRQVTRKALKNHSFAEIQIDEVLGRDTCIPHLDSQGSVFFQNYQTEQFEEIFEDLKGHYKRLCEEEPNPGSMGDENEDYQNFSQFQ